jgi:hypothetical protein
LNALKVYGLDDFKTASGAGLNDPSLGSQDYLSAARLRPVEAPITQSVFQNTGSAFQSGNVPGFLQNQINQLNSENFLARSAQQDMVDRLFIAASEGDDNAWEALRAVGIQPGAAATFVSPIKQKVVAEAEAKNLEQQASLNYQRALQGSAVQKQRQELESKRLKLQALPRSSGIIGSGMQSDPWGRKKLQQEIFDLEFKLRKGDSATSRVAQAALGGGNTTSNAWISPYPGMPTY